MSRFFVKSAVALIVVMVPASARPQDYPHAALVEPGGPGGPVWTASGGTGVETATLAEHEKVKIFDLRPHEAFMLSADAMGDKVQLPVGTVLMRARADRVAACELFRAPGNVNFRCLVDEDRDGRFEGYFRVVAPSEFLFFDVKADNRRVVPLDEAVPYRALDEAGEVDPIPMYLSFANRKTRQKGGLLAYCVERTDLRTVWGGELPRCEYLEEDIPFEDAGLPKTGQILGATITLHSVEDDRVSVTISNPPGDREVVFF